MREEILGIKTTGEKINNLFKAAYKRNEIFVNRKYQRKLVWTLQEKQEFIDTLLRGYPVPLFLFAKTKDGKEREIIDGLQRLDAIFSFIKNEFPIMWEGKEQYCNKTALFCPREPFKQKKPVLDFDLCMTFGEYELPTTTTDFADTDTINEIFKRINSSGRKLARQELRQAGVVSDFSDLVRKTAAEIRGDFTPHDSVDIFDMPKISISNKRLEYGIDVKEIFWVKHDIITETEIRKSKDEEALAQIYGYMILGKGCGISSEVIDKMYNLENSYCQKIEQLIKQKNSSYYFSKFLNVFDCVKNIFESTDTTFTDVLFEERKISNKLKLFISLFIAIYKIMENGKILDDPAKVICALKLAVDIDKLKSITKSRIWNKFERDKTINFFKEKLPTVYPTQNENFREDSKDLIAHLCASAATETETTMLEFKISTINFRNGNVRKSVIDSIVQTFTAINNLKSNKTGFIVIGVANSEDSAIAYDNSFSSGYSTNGSYWITGLKNEIDKFYNKDNDRYLRDFKNNIYKQPVSNVVKEHLINNTFFIHYCHRLLLVIKCDYKEILYRYNCDFYLRHSCNTDKITECSDEVLKMLTGSTGKMIKVV